MHRSRRLQLFLAALLTSAFAGAGCSPKALPVNLRYCNAVVEGSSVSLDVSAVSQAAKAIENITVEVDFGSRRARGLATFAPPLQPGQARDASVAMNARSGSVGPAMHCLPVRVTYVDGSVETAPATP
jgi:hypothetical protein